MLVRDYITFVQSNPFVRIIGATKDNDKFSTADVEWTLGDIVGESDTEYEFRFQSWGAFAGSKWISKEETEESYETQLNKWKKKKASSKTKK